MKLRKFIIIGSHFDAMARLNVEAVSKEDALRVYHSVFGERIRGWMDPTVSDLSERVDMVKHWNGHMDSIFLSM